MKRAIMKWSLRLSATVILIGGLLLAIVLNPSLLYAERTIVGNHTVYHNSEVGHDFFNQLENVTNSLKKSELYDPTFKLDICLNDGSFYPTLLEKIRGQAFAWGFYNKVVLQGTALYHDNLVELNGFYWNLEQLITHEAIHCYQYNKLGFLGSNPVAGYPNWKWEGYPEFVARQREDQQDLVTNIDRLLGAIVEDKDRWDIEFTDGSISPINYYSDWLLVTYCINVKQLSFKQLLNDPAERAMVEEEMMAWKEEETKKRTHNTH